MQVVTKIILTTRKNIITLTDNCYEHQYIRTLLMDPIRTQSIPEVVVQEILNMISEGSWKAGSQLPPQRQLAQELGVSMAL